MYTPTPINYYDDYIQHGWLKDQAAKVHKYLERWRGKNGKWYYRYKSKAQELGTKIRRKLKGINNNEITSDYGRHPGPKKYGKFSNSKSLSQRNVNAGIEAGRKRTKKNGNLTSRGYSGSQGSGEKKRVRNTGTRKSAGREYGLYNIGKEKYHYSDAADRTGKAYYRTKNKKTKETLNRSWITNSKNNKIAGSHSNGIDYGPSSEWDAHRRLTWRGYPSSGSWSSEVKINNKATKNSVRRKSRTKSKNWSNKYKSATSRRIYKK